jgi:transmembrane sensor
VYKVGSSKIVSEITFNSIETPRGGQYEVYLPDGTHVWLNAATKLTYPTAFNGSTREVKLSGEAYFEVARNKDKPFIVSAASAKVEVLGTHFNISAYSEDAELATTLLEGSVRMSNGTLSKLLKPGEQGLTLKGQQNISIKQADVEQVMAWTKGNFVFNDVSIKEVMKIAARWYDIEVEYHGKVEFKKFGGTTSRYQSIIELLDDMKETGRINYKIEGRRVILMN